MKDLTKDIFDAMKVIGTNHMPTRSELEVIGLGSLSSRIQNNGGFVYWREELGLEAKKNIRKWSDNDIAEAVLGLSLRLSEGEYMPSSNQIGNFEDGASLHNKIARSLGYRGWAEKLGLKVNISETQLGQDYEDIGLKKLNEMGYKVESMTTKFAFDLLLNDTVSVDVKCGCAYTIRGSRVHTFGINKIVPTSDLYIIFALDEEGKNIERTFVIPSHHIPMKSLNMGADSKYNKYLNRFDYIDKYIEFKKSIK